MLTKALRTTLLLLAVSLASIPLLADDHNVDFDKSTDFSKLKTFVIRFGKIDSSRPELNNSLVIKKISDAVRTALTAKGLTETTVQPDVMVEISAGGVDFNIGPGHIANPIDLSRGDRGGWGPRGPLSTGERGPVDFSEGTLVIDVNALKSGQPARLIWRGVYHDTERNSSKLAQKFPDDAKKLLAEYPSKKK